MSEKSKKMRLACIELHNQINNMPDGGPAMASVYPGDKNTGGYEVEVLPEAAGLEAQNFPGFIVRSPRTGKELRIYPSAVKCVTWVVDDAKR